MTQGRTLSVHSFLRILDGVASVGLYGVSTVFSLILFTKLAAPATVLAFQLFAVVYEVGKVAIWVQGIMKRNILFIIIAIAMTLGSLVASAVALIGEQEDRRLVQEASLELASLRESELEAQLELIADEREVTLDRLSRGVGIADDNRVRLDELADNNERFSALLYEAKQKRISQSLETEQVAGSENPLSSLAQILKINEGGFKLGYTLFLSLVLEIMGLTTSAGAVAGDVALKKKREYIETDTLTHILKAGSASRTVCGGSYRGVATDKLVKPLCQDCAKEVL